MSFILRCFIISLSISIPALVYSQAIDSQTNRGAACLPLTETVHSRQQPVRDNVPMIAAMVGAVDADTLHKNLEQLQNWGSRFMLNDNHKEIASWLMARFLSYGYTDVKLDSFYNIVNTSGFMDSTWQYNVICTLRGSSAPEEIYLVGGHYDSYSDPDPYTVAPGADNNGSAVAATLEIARVMAKMNFQPQATIQFTLFGAEELGLFGSRFDAQKSAQAGRDIRFMFSMDMIANDPDNLNVLRGAWYPGSEWLSYAAAEAIERYTGISVELFSTPFNGGSDSYSYWTEGFPAFACIEKDFSPYCFTPADTLGNCSVPYLTKVTGGVLATLAEQQLLPTPQNVKALSNKTDITVQWKATNNTLVRGVNIYRSDTTGKQYQKINPIPVSGTIYHDLTVEPNRQYYYVLTTLNDSLQEGGFSQEVTGARFNFCDTLLVLANLKGTMTTPDSLSAFYRAALDTIPFVWHDINATMKVNIGILSRYRSILWMTNTVNFEVPDNDLIQGVSEFISNGGNLLFAGFNPMRFWTNGTAYPVKIPETMLFHKLFKADSVDRKAQCLMFRANAVSSAYDTLNVDPLKYLDKNYPGQIYNAEVFSPAQGAGVIYRLDTKYDSTTSLGKMKHRPVGLEYMGTDFKSILLSFPLFYIDTNDVRKFLHYVLTEKFVRPTDVEPIVPADPYSLHICPNPITNICHITFNLDRPGPVKLTIMSMQGQITNTWTDGNPEEGNHSIFIQIGSQEPGLYQIVLQTNDGRAVKKVILLR